MFWRKDPQKLLAELLDNEQISIARYGELKEQIIGLGRRAIPALMAGLEAEDDEGESRAMIVGGLLSKIGQPGLEALRERLYSDVPPRLYVSLRVLWEFEAKAASEIGFLSRLLDSPDAEIRGRAAHALGRIGPAPDQPAQQLANLASDDLPNVQRSALFALERIGYDPSILTEICADCLSSEDDGVFFSATCALEKAGCNSTRFACRISKRLSEQAEPNYPNSSAWRLLMRAESLDQASVENLLGYLGKPKDSGWNRKEAISVLWHHTRNAAPLLPHLEQMLSNEDELESACDAICALGPAATPLLPKLLAQLSEQQDYWDFCWAAVDALASMGPAAEPALPMLEQMKSHPSELVRVRAEKAIRSINGEPADNESQ